MKILIGYDGSVPADGAVHELSRAGLPAKAQAVILTVTTPWVEYESPHGPKKQVWPGTAARSQYRKVLEQTLEDSRALAERGMRHLQQLFPEWKISVEAVMDDSAEALLKKAEAWKADLIVLGSHGRSAIGRLLLGSVSQKVLHHARCGVRITRAGIVAKNAPLRLILGFDGSRDAEGAVDRVASRRWPRGTEAKVIGVFDAREIPAGIWVDGVPRHHAWIEKEAQAAVKRLAADGIKATYEVRDGDPRAVLLKAAKDWDAHCIHLGSRGLNAAERFLVGSVSSAVATHAPCTVEISRGRRKA